MSDVTVSAEGSPAAGTVERIPPYFVGMAAGLPGFAALWPCQRSLKCLVDNQTALRRAATLLHAQFRPARRSRL
jgi:hypothetical protein